MFVEIPIILLRQEAYSNTFILKQYLKGIFPIHIHYIVLIRTISPALLNNLFGVYSPPLGPFSTLSVELDAQQNPNSSWIWPAFCFPWLTWLSSSKTHKLHFKTFMASYGSLLLQKCDAFEFSPLCLCTCTGKVAAVRIQDQVYRCIPFSVGIVQLAKLGFSKSGLGLIPGSENGIKCLHVQMQKGDTWGKKDNRDFEVHVNILITPTIQKKSHP